MYAASKGAVSNLTRSIALEYAQDGIHCNAICPGCKYMFYVIETETSPDFSSFLVISQVSLLSDTATQVTDTAIFRNTVKTASEEVLSARHPLHGIGQPEDIVGAAIFLASSEARWVTGVLLPVDGGYTAQ